MRKNMENWQLVVIILGILSFVSVGFALLLVWEITTGAKKKKEEDADDSEKFV